MKQVSGGVEYSKLCLGLCPSLSSNASPPPQSVELKRVQDVLAQSGIERERSIAEQSRKVPLTPATQRPHKVTSSPPVPTYIILFYELPVISQGLITYPLDCPTKSERAHTDP